MNFPLLIRYQRVNVNACSLSGHIQYIIFSVNRSQTTKHVDLIQLMVPIQNHCIPERQLTDNLTLSRLFMLELSICLSFFSIVERVIFSYELI